MVLLDPPLGRHGSRPLPHGIWLPVPPVNTAAPCFDLREAMSMSPDPHQAREKDTSGSLESSNCNQDNNLITIILEC
jgi:hypothetical protein